MMIRVLPLLVTALLASGPNSPEPPPAPAAPSPAVDPSVEKLSDNLYRVETLLVDRTKRQVTIPGKVNAATVLEYLANSRQGFKAYESALELDASPEAFNVALLLIGLESSRGVPSRFKFDPEVPQGDPVEIWVEWQHGGAIQKVRAEQLVYDAARQRPLSRSPWVYTGSVVLEDGTYLAKRDGVLIGLMHTPESIIDRGAELESEYGELRINAALGLPPGAPVTVIVKAGARDDG